MPVCPKCGFTGQDQDACERCGVIYARMHTVFEPKPNLEALKNGPPSRPGGPPSRAGGPSSKPKAEAPAIAHVAIPMPSRPPTQLRAVPMPDAPTEMAVSPVAGGPPARSEVTMVPILPPPPEAKSRVPLLVSLLIVSMAAWGVLKFREARQESAGGDVRSVEDSDYYDLAVGSVVSDARMQLRRITDPEAAKAAREALYARQRRLRVELTEAPLTPAHRQALSDVLDEVVSFLKNDVEAALTHLSEAPAPPSDDDTIVVAQPGGAPPPAPAPVAGMTDQTALKHADQLLLSLPH